MRPYNPKEFNLEFMQENESYQSINPNQIINPNKKSKEIELAAANKEMKLAAIRADILSLPAEKALDSILDAHFPASLIQSFPEQDLHFLMHYIGEEDFLPVLALASSEQWEYILDVEVWESDKLNLNKITNVLSLLYKADPKRVIRWTIKEKTEFIEYYLFKNIEIKIREHDQEPSDFMDLLGDNKNEFITIDSIFYFRFKEVINSTHNYKNIDEEEYLNKEAYLKNSDLTEDSYDESLIKSDTETFITDMLNTLADMDISVFHALLLETPTIITAETEEEEFRLKNVRLAEKGFLPPHEAAAVYQPLKAKDLKQRLPIYLEKSSIESELPNPPMSISLIGNIRENLFDSALKYLHKSMDINIKNENSKYYRYNELILNLQSELAFLVNSVSSADKKIVRSKEELTKIVEKTSCYLSLGMEIIYKELQLKLLKNLTPEIGSSILIKYPLKDIFRVASGAVFSIKEKARRWYDNESYIAKVGLPITFLGERLMGVFGGVMLNRPLYFHNYADNNSITPYRDFVSIKDIKNSCNELESIFEIDKMVSRLKPNLSMIANEFVTWKSLFLTLWAVDRIKLNADLNLYNSYSIPLNKFKPFFIQLLNLKERKSYSDDDVAHKTGKIESMVRNDFFHWLCENNVVLDNEIPKSVKNIFNTLFDEIEDEYGSISPNDIDYRVIYHFMVMPEQKNAE